MKTNKLIVVDLEATCDNVLDEEYPSEIIQIGIAVLDIKTGLIGSTLDYLVRPLNLNITEFCTTLTGITRRALVDQGRPLREVLNTIKKQCSLKHRPWCSWGMYDKFKLTSECQDKGIECPFNQNHFDLKTLHAMSRGLSRGVGLQKAIEIEGIVFEGRPHSAVWDAVNTARIAKILFNKKTEGE